MEEKERELKEPPQLDITEISYRLSYLGLGTVVLSLAYIVWSSVGYLNVFAIIGESLLLLVGVSLMALSLSQGDVLMRYGKYATLGVTLTVYIFLGYLLYVMPYFGTDELAIDYYSAVMFLHSQNPYIASMSPTFYQALGIPQNVLTPLTTGGYVISLGYPALSFLMMIPIVLAHLKPSLILTVFAGLPFLLVYYQYRKERLENLVPIVYMVMALDAEFLYFSAGSVTDIVWTVLVMASLIWRRPRISGLLMGLALSEKQIPIFILPYLLIYIFRDQGGLRGLVNYLSATLSTFFVINGYFILVDPYSYFRAVLSPELMPLIGIGFGLSQLSFTGILDIPRWAFTASMFLVWGTTILAYALYYDRLKYVFPLLPVLAFLFSYRLLDNYVIYWPLLTLPLIPDMLRENSLSRGTTKDRDRVELVARAKKVLIASLILTSALAPLYAGDVMSRGDPGLEFKIVGYSQEFTNSTYGQGEYLNSLTLNVTVTSGKFNGTLYLRDLPQGEVMDPNGLIWCSVSNVSLYQGKWTLVLFQPEGRVDLIPAWIPSRIVVFNNGLQGSLYVQGWY